MPGRRRRHDGLQERAGALMWTARLAMDESVSGEAARSAILTQFEQASALAHSIHDEQLRLTLSFTTPGTTRAAAAPVLADIVPRAEELVRDSMGVDAFDSAARDGSALSWDAAPNEAMAICQGAIEEPGGDVS